MPNARMTTHIRGFERKTSKQQQLHADVSNPEMFRMSSKQTGGSVRSRQERSSKLLRVEAHDAGRTPFIYTSLVPF